MPWRGKENVGGGPGADRYNGLQGPTVTIVKFVPHPIDRLHAAIREKHSPLCVGLDPRWESLPLPIRRRYPDSPRGWAAAYEDFCGHVLDLVAPFTAVVKPQCAFFEALGTRGHLALERLIEKAHRLNLLVILDAKRGDIASTAMAYAEAAFHTLQADALTINPYLGRDAVEPFLTEARRLGRALYVLVRTSNPGAGLFQDVRTDHGRLFEVVGREVAAWSDANLGTDGFGDVGAVIGATSPRELAELRQLMPRVPFLVPGYGAQGGTAAGCRPAFRNGSGAVVNSSRGILFPYSPEDGAWEEKIVSAARHAATELQEASHS